ncbi:MAG: Bax inhibitor-1/YccA family protein [Firmicutes bacterium]|nr:Bax inhibitor-1/YccA family protein [Bacillota bacterium]
MTCALALTALIAFQVSTSEVLVKILYGTPGILIGLGLVELALVVILSWAINKMSAAVATIMFFTYAALNGATLAVIFLKFSPGSIAVTFFVTAGTFAAMSIYGFVTKSDLTKWGNLLLMALLGIVIASVVNFFLVNNILSWIISCIGVIVFVGLTAYDTQKIKEMFYEFNEGSEEYIKFAVIGALILYLDFINLFLSLLKFLGRRN